jgi:hypothetical protein
LAQADDLYELVTERAGKASIFTANRQASDWYSLFPNPVVAESILDRIVNSDRTSDPAIRPRTRSNESAEALCPARMRQPARSEVSQGRSSTDLLLTDVSTLTHPARCHCRGRTPVRSSRQHRPRLGRQGPTRQPSRERPRQSRKVRSHGTGHRTALSTRRAPIPMNGGRNHGTTTVDEQRGAP